MNSRIAKPIPRGCPRGPVLPPWPAVVTLIAPSSFATETLPPPAEGVKPGWRSGDAGEEEGTGLPEHLARDHEPLHLLGALVDLRDLRVAHEPLHGVLLDVPVAAEDLH